MTNLVISEVFGPTVQGEGPSAGRRCAFIRLGMCNLDCRWCDTPYTWDWTGKNGVVYDKGKELRRSTVEGLAQQMLDLDVPMVVITGGEPLLQRKALDPLVVRLRAKGIEVEIETNGTRDPGPDLLGVVHRWNVSPKLSHSGVSADLAWKPDVLAQFIASGNAAFKFVCKKPSDVVEAAQLCALAKIPGRMVWIMPEGVDALTVEQRMADLADSAIAFGFNLSGRMHVTTWGDERGR